MSLALKGRAQKRLIHAARDMDPVRGFTHAFYRYPARFSPQFARAAIELFTEPGDLVLDPFVGAGTTLVEAAALGRRSVGSDISSLAVFVSRAKTNQLKPDDRKKGLAWANDVVPYLRLHSPVSRPSEWIEKGYQRNISGRETWHVRKQIELVLAKLPVGASEQLTNFLRCAVLSTGQWALDCRYRIPTAQDFRARLRQVIHEMIQGLTDWGSKVEESGKQVVGDLTPIVLNCSAGNLHHEASILSMESPRLILTSPPYPGVHVVYHRWQVRGRRETAAPFWIANCEDGRGASYYTFGDRQQSGLESYFENLLAAFSSVVRLCSDTSVFLQLVAFSNPLIQLPRYLDAMTQSGLREHKLQKANGDDGRIWREVPNRRWYAGYRSEIFTKREVLLVHRLR